MAKKNVRQPQTREDFLTDPNRKTFFKDVTIQRAVKNPITGEVTNTSVERPVVNGENKTSKLATSKQDVLLAGEGRPTRQEQATALKENLATQQLQQKAFEVATQQDQNIQPTIKRTEQKLNEAGSFRTAVNAGLQDAAVYGAGGAGIGSVAGGIGAIPGALGGVAIGFGKGFLQETFKQIDKVQREDVNNAEELAQTSISNAKAIIKNQNKGILDSEQIMRNAELFHQVTQDIEQAHANLRFVANQKYQAEVGGGDALRNFEQYYYGGGYQALLDAYKASLLARPKNPVVDNTDQSLPEFTPSNFNP